MSDHTLSNLGYTTHSS